MYYYFAGDGHSTAGTETELASRPFSIETGSHAFASLVNAHVRPAAALSSGSSGGGQQQQLVAALRGGNGGSSGGEEDMCTRAVSEASVRWVWSGSRAG